VTAAAEDIVASGDFGVAGQASPETGSDNLLLASACLGRGRVDGTWCRRCHFLVRQVGNGDSDGFGWGIHGWPAGGRGYRAGQTAPQLSGRAQTYADVVCKLNQAIASQQQFDAVSQMSAACAGGAGASKSALVHAPHVLTFFKSTELWLRGQG
jgi:hypothetical protein